MIDLFLDERAQCKGKSLLRAGGMQGGDGRRKREEKRREEKRKGGAVWSLWASPTRAHPH